MDTLTSEPRCKAFAYEHLVSITMHTVDREPGALESKDKRLNCIEGFWLGFNWKCHGPYRSDCNIYTWRDFTIFIRIGAVNIIHAVYGNSFIFVNRIITNVVSKDGLDLLRQIRWWFIGRQLRRDPKVLPRPIPIDSSDKELVHLTMRRWERTSYVYG